MQRHLEDEFVPTKNDKVTDQTYEDSSEDFIDTGDHMTDIKKWMTITHSSSEKCNWGLTKKQMYFDFVPPSLNNFEYFLTKLINMEEALHRHYPNKSPEPTLSRYMSFTFVFGNHIDLSQASSELFNAEPVEKENENNDSGIVVVYLDTNMSFANLLSMAMTQSKYKRAIHSRNTFLAVHSKELLREKTKIIDIMTPYFGEKLKIIDANEKMEIFYEKFEDILRKAFKKIKNRIESLKKQTDETIQEKLCSIEQRFISVHKRYIDDTPTKLCGTTEQTTLLMKSHLSSLKDKGLQGYTTESNTLILCFQRLSDCSKLTDKMIPFEFKQRFPAIHIIQTEDPLFKYHHSITGGDKLHPFRHTASSYGTIGMFGSVSQRDGSSKTCCISSPHVISRGQTAYISGATVPLGNCIWPPTVEKNCINVEDISVIYLDQVHRNIEIRKMFEKQITLFKGDRTDLKRRKVYKFGATTSKTIGFIRDPEFVLTIGDPISVFLIEPEDVDDDSSRFSQPGDSGAIVFTKFGQNVVALSMIFGGDVTLEGFAKNNSIAVDLQQAIQRFADHNEGQSLRLDTL